MVGTNILVFSLFFLIRYHTLLFERPSFKRMIADVECGRINLIICKDLSRLGRNYIMCGQFTEMYFPSKNVRFIALNDGIDSLHSNNDIAPFKNILNDMYAKDISVKVRSALYAKAKRGEYLGACDPYGYFRDPADKHHLLVNHEVAPNIVRMYNLIVAGFGMHKIANIFNSEGFLSPSDYTRFRNHNPDDGEFVPKVKWQMKTIRCIVENEMYVGNMVQCRKRSQSYRTQKIVLNPKEDWVVVNGTHEGIVTKELFDKVQAIIEQRPRIIKKTGEPHIFAGVFYCGECGWRMAHHVRSTAKGDYYSCGKYRANGQSGCSSHHVNYSDIYQLVLASIRENARLVTADEEAAVKRIKTAKSGGEIKRLAAAKKELASAKKRLSESDYRVRRAYEDNVSGKLPDKLFNKFIRDYETEDTKLTALVESLQAEIITLESANNDVSAFIDLIKPLVGLTELNRNVLLALIDKIVVSEPAGAKGKIREQKITIFYKFVGAL